MDPRYRAGQIDVLDSRPPIALPPMPSFSHNVYTDTLVPPVLAAASQQRDALVAVREEIRTLEAYFEATRTSLKAIESTLEERLEHIVFPILQLPRDIISAIFILCLPRRRFLKPSIASAPLVLTRVNREFRHIAHSIPYLWSSLVWKLNSSENDGLSLHWLSHASTLELSIAFKRSSKLRSLYCMVNSELTPEILEAIPDIEFLGLKSHRFIYMHQFLYNMTRNPALLPHLDTLRLNPGEDPYYFTGEPDWPEEMHHWEMIDLGAVLNLIQTRPMLRSVHVHNVENPQGSLEAQFRRLFAQGLDFALPDAKYCSILNDSAARRD
ncbi:hypothetical protein HMN09_01146400 [Mycena chlorophos]|uniref:F-box domain-containing protein n=1 Tax=Mycena chlorophos TaxID=658473 RepID=A0A8H6S8J3_MYCCL|nr:hypothetical protein HMN09_01146400 [Mycena chlorophos]